MISRGSGGRGPEERGGLWGLLDWGLGGRAAGVGYLTGFQVRADLPTDELVALPAQELGEVPGVIVAVDEPLQG